MVPQGLRPLLQHRGPAGMEEEMISTRASLVGTLACPQLDVQSLGPGGGLVALGAGGRLAADPSWFCALYVVFIPRSTKCYPILTPLEAFETQSPVHLSGDIPAYPAPHL